MNGVGRTQGRVEAHGDFLSEERVPAQPREAIEHDCCAAYCAFTLY